MFWIPCNQYVLSSFDDLPHVFVDLCLAHKSYLWHWNCIWISKLSLSSQFRDLGIVSFSNASVRYSFTCKDSMLEKDSENANLKVFAHKTLKAKNQNIPPNNRWSRTVPSSWLSDSYSCVLISLWFCMLSLHKRYDSTETTNVSSFTILSKCFSLPVFNLQTWKWCCCFLALVCCIKSNKTLIA